MCVCVAETRLFRRLRELCLPEYDGSNVTKANPANRARSFVGGKTRGGGVPANHFNCPSCNALYHLIKAEAGPETINSEIACRVCGAQLPGRDGNFVLKYFLLREPARPDPRARRQIRQAAEVGPKAAISGSARPALPTCIRTLCGNAPKARYSWSSVSIALGGPVGNKWTARLRVDFEMEEGAPENLAQNRLRIAVGQFEHFIEIGAGIAKTLVKVGSAKVEILAQGPTA